MKKKSTLLAMAVLTALICISCASNKGAVVENPTYTIYFVRHGQTLFNVQDRAQGWCDSPLTETGISQGKQLHDKMSGIQFDGAYTSISERAYDTCNYILEGTGITPIINEDLKEMNFGSMEGEPGNLLWDSYPYRLANGWTDKGGEDWQMLGERATRAVQKVVDDNPNGGTFLLTSHGMTILAYAQTNFADSPVLADFFTKYPTGMPNCGCIKVVYSDGRFDLVEMPVEAFLLDK